MSGNEPIVYVVDDDGAVLKAVTRVLRSAGFNVAPYDSPHRFLREHDPSRRGCAVLDVAMPDIDGLELQRSLAVGSASVPRPIIFLTGRANVPQTVSAMKHGAVDFLTKPVDDASLLAAVRTALERDHRTRSDRANREEIECRLATLTPRERQVLAQVIAGRLNKQIAAELGTTEGTIKVHRARVMHKMGAGSVPDLVRIVERAPGPGVGDAPHYTKVQ
jgi:FixJ family two-component response regulator